MAGFEGIGNALAGFGEFIEKKPEVFATVADKIGTSLDPNNAFAGVGTDLGQSSLADKAKKEQEKKNALFQQAILQALGGDLSGATGNNASPRLDAQGNETTPADQDGNTSVLFKTDPATGKQVKTTTELVPDGKQANGNINLQDFLLA